QAPAASRPNPPSGVTFTVRSTLAQDFEQILFRPLESRLSKEQILALWLDTLEMSEGPGGWMTGFNKASSLIYGRPPAELNNTEFTRLVAVLISPSSYKL
ncbi:transglycosylase domain-containing protein, partial [Streptococcus suis]